MRLQLLYLLVLLDEVSNLGCADDRTFWQPGNAAWGLSGICTGSEVEW